MISIDEPDRTDSPAVGRVAMTEDPTVPLISTANPCDCNSSRASGTSSPCTSGTSTNGRPREPVTVMVEPLDTDAAAGGSMLMIRPSPTDSE